MFQVSMLIVGLVLVMFINAYTLARLGLWLGLRLRTAVGASLVSLSCVAVLPSAAFLALMYFVILAAGRGVVHLLAGVACLWTILSAINASVFHAHAQHKLRTEFRQWAAWAPPETGRPKQRAMRTDLAEHYGLAR